MILQNVLNHLTGTVEGCTFFFFPVVLETTFLECDEALNIIILQTLIDI